MSPTPTGASPGRRPIFRKSSRARSEVRIRRARPADAEAIGAIARAAFAPYVAAIGKRPAPMDEDHAAAIERGGAIVAVEQDEAAPAGCEAVRGYATFLVAPPCALLSTVAVAPEYQGRGIGRALVAAVEERVRAAGAGRLSLYTNEKMTANLAFYPALGYAETGRRQEDGFARVHFEKRLLPAVATKPPVDGLYGRRRGQSGARAPHDDPRLLDLSQPFDRAALFPDAAVLRVEIGFGAGEHLIHHAKSAPHAGMIGVEPFETGLARALADARAEGLDNVRLYPGDARTVLDWLPAASLDRVDVLYPDPWPKRRHHKRRFISRPGLDRIARALAPGGTLRFASDIADYVRWTRAHVAAHPALALTGDSDTPWPNWPGTRYEAKALREGRTPHYLTATRV